MRSAHEVLGISPSATLDEAEDAYHRLLRREHPDLHHGAPPDRLAEAERRTRELNAAIGAIRTGAARVDVGAARGARTAAPSAAADPSGAAGDGDDGDAPWDRDGSWDDEAGEWRTPPAEPAMAACPWCGARYARAVELKDHVFDEHDLRLDRRERPALLGGRVGRVTRRAAHLPLWAVIPLNGLVALVVGVVLTTAIDDLLGWWAAAIAMSPTAVVLIDRLSDIDL